MNCPRCGLTGGTHLSYQVGADVTTRWVCPQCASRTEELLAISVIQAEHFLARRIRMQAEVTELLAEVERICGAQGVLLVDEENHPTRLGEVLADLRKAASDPVLVLKSS